MSRLVESMKSPMDLLLEEHQRQVKLYGSVVKAAIATGLMMPIAGGDAPKGYNETADLPTKTLDGVPLEQLYAEFNRSIALIQAMRRPLVERLSFRVAKPFEEVPQLVEADFEEADEFGQPKGIRLGPKWNMGFDLRYFDLGIRYTFRFLGTATAAQIRQLHNQALEADQRLIYKTVLGRAFRNITDQATLDSGLVVDVFPFYNGSNPVAPPQWNYETHLTTHDHYLVSGAATVDSGDVDEMFTHIRHHGYTEGADVILLVNSAQAAVIRRFRVSTGATWDFIPSVDGPSFILDGQVVGGLSTQDSGARGIPGFIGKYGTVNVVENDRIPPDYMLMFASGGTFADRNPIGIREHENAGLRGLKLIPQFERYPLREAFYHHAIGSGVRHRGAGVVMQIKASGDYEIPTIEAGAPGGR